MLKSESFTSLYDAREATVSTGGDDLTGVERDRRSTVGATNLLNHRHFCNPLAVLCVYEVQHEFFPLGRKAVIRFNTTLSDR